MKSRKLIILGIDCLDYHLVRKWQLHHYILDSFGHHFVGLDLYTPVIWAKFLTGINVTKHGFNTKNISRIKKVKSLYYIRSLIEDLTRLIKEAFVNEQNKEKTLTLLDPKKAFIKLITSNSNDLTLYERTMLKLLVKASYAERLPHQLFKRTFVFTAMQKGYKTLLIEFPPVNDDIYSIIRNVLYFYIDAPINERLIFLEHVWNITETTINTLLKRLDDYDFILWYTPYIDIASHMFYRPKNLKYMLKLYSMYKKLGEKIKEIITKLYNDAVVLIVSDHGYNPARQDHSYFGYWSINAQIFKKPRTVLDFAPLIMELF